MTQNSDKPRDDSDLVQFKLRIREGLRSQIEEAASISGISMNSEIAERLHLSLREDEVLQSTRLRALLLVLAVEIGRAERQTGKKWHEDLATMIAAERLIADALRRARPQPDDARALQEIRAEMGALTPRYRELETQLAAFGAVEPENAFSKFLGGIASNAKALPEEEWHQPNNATEPLSETEASVVRELLGEWQDMHSLHQRIALAEVEATKKALASMSEAEAKGDAIYKTITGSIETEHGA